MGTLGSLVSVRLETEFSYMGSISYTVTRPRQEANVLWGQGSYKFGTLPDSTLRSLPMAVLICILSSVINVTQNITDFSEFYEFF